MQGGVARGEEEGATGREEHRRDAVMVASIVLEGSFFVVHQL